MSTPATSRRLILFQGDSITDALRQRETESTFINHILPLGPGYAGKVASKVLSACPSSGYIFHNRGISGNRVTDLLARWRVDAIHLKPDWISILIGVNDTWHHFGSDRGTNQHVYATVYRLLLEETRRELPGVHFVLCEPFALPVGAFKTEWLDDLRARAATVKALADEFGATWVPFQSLFDSLLKEGPAEYWLPDGVHPSPGGHERMAAFWLEKTGLGAG